MCGTAVALLLLLNDGCKLESLRRDGGPVGDFLKQLTAKLELVLLTFLIYEVFMNRIN